MQNAMLVQHSYSAKICLESILNKTKMFIKYFFMILFFIILCLAKNAKVYALQEMLVNNHILIIKDYSVSTDYLPAFVEIDEQYNIDLGCDYASFQGMFEFKDNKAMLVVDMARGNFESVGILYYNGKKFSFQELSHYEKNESGDLIAATCYKNNIEVDYQENKILCSFSSDENHDGGYLSFDGENLVVSFNQDFTRDKLAISNIYQTYKDYYDIEDWDKIPSSLVPEVNYITNQRYNFETFRLLSLLAKSTGKIFSLKEFAAIMEGDTKALDKLIAEAAHSSKDINAAEVSAADEREEDSFTPAVSDHSGKHYFTREEVQDIVDSKRDLKDMREIAMFIVDSLFLYADLGDKIVGHRLYNIIFAKFINSNPDINFQKYYDLDFKMTEDLCNIANEFIRNKKHTDYTTVLRKEAVAMVNTAYLSFLNGLVSEIISNLNERKARLEKAGFDKTEFISLGEVALFSDVSLSIEFLNNPPLLKNESKQFFIWRGTLVHFFKEGNEITQLNITLGGKVFFAMHPHFLGNIQMNKPTWVFGVYETATSTDGETVPCLMDTVVVQ